MNRAMPLMAGAVLAVAVSAAGAEVAPGDVKIEDGLVMQSLTSQPGDPAMGREWAAGRKRGNCLACHANSDLKDEQFHGEIGPLLDGVGDRWSAEELRAILVNSKAVFGDATMMPAFYRDTGFTRPAEKFAGKTILTAQQVEDIIAYLLTLKE
jgi:sulfur-oxidizing protein SoxX